MVKSAFRPDWFSKPGDALAALMAKRELSAEVLAKELGHDAKFVRGLLEGSVAIDDKVAILLARSVGGSPAFWTGRQAQFEEGLDRAASAVPSNKVRIWLKTLPLKEMEEAGWLAKSQELRAKFKSSLLYFDVLDPEEWRERYTRFETAFSFRTSPSYESKVGALSAWLRQGEIQAEAISCAAWDTGRFRAQLPKIRRLTKAKNPAYFIPRLRTMCAEVGVAVVFVRAPSGCRASGAARFFSSKKAMIILSFRYLSDDHFWFSFFHEAAHLLLHGEKMTFVDGKIADRTDKEIEANRFAASMLLPFDQFEALTELSPRSRDVIRFAITTGVSPGIIVGQMQHHRLIAPRQLNHLKRRYNWDQILSAAA